MGNFSTKTDKDTDFLTGLLAGNSRHICGECRLYTSSNSNEQRTSSVNCRGERTVGQAQIINAFENVTSLAKREGETRGVISRTSLTVRNLICANGGHSQSEGVRRAKSLDARPVFFRA